MITKAEHAHHGKHKRDWELIRRMLTGDGAKAELAKRYFEEHPDHFKQRKRDADFTPLTRRHVSRIVGMLFQAYDDVSRSAPLLDLSSVGPDGESYTVQLIDLATKLLTYHEAYLVFKPNSGLKVVGPLSVPNWVRDEYVVKGSRVEPRQSVFNNIQETKTWTRYTPEEYEVYTKDTEDGEDKDVLLESGVWAVNQDGEADAYFVDEDGARMPPIVHVSLPWEARFGLLLARKHRAIFEMRSRRDFAASTSMNGLLQVGVDGEDIAEQIKDAIENSRILPFKKDAGKHQGIAYPTDGIKMGTAVIEEKQKELDEIAFKTLNEATRKTATEARLQHTGGAAAALTVLASTIEDAERRILKIMTQAQDFRYAGPNPIEIGSEFDVSVSWPKDYTGIADAHALIDRLFPKGMPVDAGTATRVIVDHLEDHGYSEAELDRAAIRGAVEEYLANESRTSSFGIA